MLLGNECVVVKNGKRICGTGGALANAPLVQDKSYFEVKIQSSGMLIISKYVADSYFESDSYRISSSKGRDFYTIFKPVFAAFMRWRRLFQIKDFLQLITNYNKNLRQTHEDILC